MGPSHCDDFCVCAIGGGANEGKRKESCKSRVLKKQWRKRGRVLWIIVIIILTFFTRNKAVSIEVSEIVLFWREYLLGDQRKD